MGKVLVLSRIDTLVNIITLSTCWRLVTELSLCQWK